MVNLQFSIHFLQTEIWMGMKEERKKMYFLTVICGLQNVDIFSRTTKIRVKFRDQQGEHYYPLMEVTNCVQK